MKAKLFVKIFLVIFLVFITALLGLRVFDRYSDRVEIKRLLLHQGLTPSLYDPKLVENLPEPTRRYFNYVIKPGTQLFTVAEIKMEGQFSLGNKEQPNYQNMRATQILAAPIGFIWELSLPGVVPISGSDSGLWTRFRILELIPVARSGGDYDHRRAAFGRYIAEAAFWTPAALLPSKYVTWEQIDDNTARVTIKYEGITQEVDIEVDHKGKPIKVQFMRWSNANSEKIYRLQPFGGYLRDFREVQGFVVPFDVEAGNMFGTPDYFPFFKAKLKSIRFPPRD